MLRGPKTPLKIQENESGCHEQKEKSSLLPSREQKSCRVTKSRVSRASKNENFTDGNQAQPAKRALKCPKSPRQNLGVAGSCFGLLSLPLHAKKDFPSSRAAPLGKDFATPERDKVGGKSDFGLPEQRNKSDFGLSEQRNNPSEQRNNPDFRLSEQRSKSNFGVSEQRNNHPDFGLSEQRNNPSEERNNPDFGLSEQRNNPCEQRNKHPDFGLSEQRNKSDFGLSEHRNNPSEHRSNPSEQRNKYPDFGLSEQRNKSDFGLSEHRNNPDFAAVISAEFGMAQENFGKRPLGASPASLKFRRRSTIGLRGSPENNSLIRYLAQQRSSRQKEPFTQINPFKPANVRSLKDKIDAFQASFESLQEAEGEPSKQGVSSPMKNERNLEQWKEKFTLGKRGAALKGNLSENRSRRELRICSISSPEPAGTATHPAAKEWVCEQQNPVKSLEPVLPGVILEKGHVPRCDQSGSGSAAGSDPSTRKAEGVENENLGMLGNSQGPVTPVGATNSENENLEELGGSQGPVTPLGTRNSENENLGMLGGSQGPVTPLGTRNSENENLEVLRSSQGPVTPLGTKNSENENLGMLGGSQGLVTPVRARNTENENLGMLRGSQGPVTPLGTRNSKNENLGMLGSNQGPVTSLGSRNTENENLGMLRGSQGPVTPLGTRNSENENLGMLGSNQGPVTSLGSRNTENKNLGILRSSQGVVTPLGTRNSENENLEVLRSSQGPVTPLGTKDSENENLGMLGGSQGLVTPVRARNTENENLGMLWSSQGPVTPLGTRNNENKNLGMLRSSQGPVTPLESRNTENENLEELRNSQGPVTPLGTRDTPSCDLSQSSSLLRSILKKTPGRELRDSPKEYSNSDIGRGDESAAVSSCVKTFETLQTDARTPRKKKVTFGEVLSPEIFDQSLPANTPLRRGASPGCAQAQSPWGCLGHPQQPLPRLHFGWDEEDVEPLPELLEGSAAAETPSPLENAEVAETDKPDITPTKRKQGRAEPEDTEESSSGATNTEGDINSESDKTTEDDNSTETLKRSKIQRQKNPPTTAAKKGKKTKYPSFGGRRRRKKKVKESLYGEREMVSKKPLLSPIPEIPELFSFVSSPNSPLLTGQTPRDSPQEPQAGRSCAQGLCAAAACPKAWPGTSEVPGRLESAAGSAAEFSNAVPDAEGGFDTPEHFQPGKEAPRETEAKESNSMLEKEEFPQNLPGLETKDSVRADPARRRRRSSRAFHFPPAENLQTPEAAAAAACSYNVEEILAGSLQSSSAAELRVRRSMRLSRGGTATQGLAWVQLPPEQPLRGRRSSSSSASILAAAENIHPRQPKLLPLAAPGKENQGSAAARRSFCETTAPEKPRAPSHRRRSTNSGCGKDRSKQSHSEAAESLEVRWKDFSGISDFLK